MSRREEVTLSTAESVVESGASAKSTFGQRDELMERYHHCPACGSRLHFVHFTDFQKNVTQETAKCPECGIRARRLLHKLQ
jgi:DNA-directed RNA polymerase subunit RPC12/RpoP